MKKNDNSKRGTPKQYTGLMGSEFTLKKEQNIKNKKHVDALKPSAAT